MKFKFNRGFQVEILALMFQNWDFLTWAAEVVKPEYFEDRSLVWYYQAIVDYYRKYNKKPSETVISNELKKAVRSKVVRKEEIRAYSEILKALDNHIDASEYVQDEVLRFCKHQALKRILLEQAPLLKDEEDPDVLDKAFDIVQKGMNVGLMMKSGIDYLGDYEERIRNRLAGEEGYKIPIGIPDLDLLINGGVRNDQFCLWVGATSGGKSIALVHVGKRALVEGRKVVHYTLEESGESIAASYDANIARVKISDIETKEANDKIAKKLREFRGMYGNALQIREFPAGQASVDTIRADLIQLINGGFKPDLVIIDYLDVIKHTTSYSSMYEDYKVTVTKLRGLVQEFNIPIHSATQVNRAGNNPHLESFTPEHISESMQKIFIADIVLGICLTVDERKNNRARVIVMKNRKGRRWDDVKIGTAYDRMTFYDAMIKLTEVDPQGADQKIIEDANKDPIRQQIEDKKDELQKVSFPVVDFDNE